MARALALAERGLYTTTPNPRVGCVIVKDGAVIGEGWHERAGAPHAEVNALADARARGLDPRGATLYVTLEPCNHTGPHAAVHRRRDRGRHRTCRRGDGRPEPGSGPRRATRLRAAGIAVDVGLLRATRRASSTSASCRG